MASRSDLELTQLGRDASIPSDPAEARLEWVVNPHPDRLYLVRFTLPEFTSICPVTRQPDYAHLVIDYVPRQRLLESKSLKLFLGAFRNHGAFHESCTVMIAKRLEAVLAPNWVKVSVLVSVISAPNRRPPVRPRRR